MQNAIQAPVYPVQNSINNFSSDEVQRVLAELAKRDYSQNTKKALLSDLGAFFGWYQKINGKVFSFAELAEMDVIDFRENSKNAKAAVSTINRRLVSIRIFCDVAVDLGILEKNPARKVKQLKSQKLAPKSLTEQDLRKVLKTVEVWGSLRDRLIFQFMAWAGLRASEVANLRVADIQISDRKGVALIRSSKGNKTREVPLNRKIRSLVVEYFAEVNPQDKLFRGQRGAITTPAIGKIVEKYGKRAGVNLHPHSLRHTFAHNYLKLNLSDIVGLAQILGHSNINTTAIYTQNRIEDLQDRVETLSFIS